MDYETLFKGGDMISHHYYFGKKKVKSFGAFLMSKKFLEVSPIYAALDPVFAFNQEAFIAFPLKNIKGEIIAAQLMNDRGARINIPKQLNGAFHAMGHCRNTILIGEDYESMATLHEVTGELCVCAMDVKNLYSVGRVFRETYPLADIVICADNDRESMTNVGIEEAKRIAFDIGAEVVAPMFAEGEPGVNFCDLALRRRDGFIKEMFEALAEERKPKPMDVGMLFKTVEPEVAFIADNVMTENSITMVRSLPKLDKRVFALSLANAIACGKDFLRWKIPRARKVLYVAGDVRLNILTQQLMDVCTGANATPMKGFFRVFVENDQKISRFDIAKKEVQERIEGFAEDTELLVLDSTSSLIGPKGWGRVRVWLASLKAKGISVLFLHDSDDLRKDAILDSNIIITDNYKRMHGLNVTITYKRSTTFRGERIGMFVARSSTTKALGTVWEIDGCARGTAKQIVFKLLDEGMCAKDIAAETGYAYITVHLIKQKWKKQNGQVGETVNRRG